MADGVSPETVEQARCCRHRRRGQRSIGCFSFLVAASLPLRKASQQPRPARINAPASLFAGDYQFAKSAFQVLSKEKEFAQWVPDDDNCFITLTAPKDLQDRLRQLPREVIDANNSYMLSAKPDRGGSDRNRSAG